MSDSSHFPTLARVALKLGLTAEARRELLAAAVQDADNPRPQGQARAGGDDDALLTDPATQAGWARAFGVTPG
jgi:hypothetical protein